MIGVLFALSITATTLAWVLTERRRAHLPIAILLSVGLVSDVLRSTLIGSVLRGARAVASEGVLTGFGALAAHVDAALFLAWPCALACAGIVVFCGAPRRTLVTLVVLAFSVLVMVIATTYPWARGATLAKLYAAANLTGVGISVGCATTWYVRTEPHGERPNTAQSSLLLILPLELAALLGSWRAGIFDTWDLSRLVYLVMFSMLVLAQGGWIWRSRRFSRASSSRRSQGCS